MHGTSVLRNVAALRLCIEAKSADEIAVELARMNAQALERRLKAVQERQSREDKSKPVSQPKSPARPAEPAEPSPEQI